METAENGGDNDKICINSHWYWAIASVSQLGWAVSSYRKGYTGDHRFMPLKAFAVASLFLGASASASVAFLKVSGIHKVNLYSFSMSFKFSPSTSHYCT